MTSAPRTDKPPTRAPVQKPPGLHPLQLWRLQRVVIYIDAHLSDDVTLRDLSNAAGFSPMHFASQFLTATGVRPHDYVLRRKVEEAQVLLITSGLTIVDIAMRFGFRSQSHFTTVFKRLVGCPPLRWQHARRRQIQSAGFRLRQLKRACVADTTAVHVAEDPVAVSGFVRVEDGTGDTSVAAGAASC